MSLSLTLVYSVSNLFEEFFLSYSEDITVSGSCFLLHNGLGRIWDIVAIHPCQYQHLDSFSKLVQCIRLARTLSSHSCLLKILQEILLAWKHNITGQCCGVYVTLHMILTSAILLHISDCDDMQISPHHGW